MLHFCIHDEGWLRQPMQSERQIAPRRVKTANIPITSFFIKYSIAYARIGCQAVIPRELHAYSLINALSLSGMPASSDTQRSTRMCRSYFSRRAMIFAIIGDAW